MTMQTRASRPHFERLGEIVRLVERFEDGTLPRKEWNHAAHLTVALWYLMLHDEATATQKTIDGIRAYNHANGIRQSRTGGYHETITLFWLRIAARYAEGLHEETDALDAINRFVAVYTAQPKLVFEYYSKERIGSWQARYFWVAPDLRPLD